MASRACKHAALVTLGLILAVFALSAVITQGGKCGFAGRGVDWAHHLSLIETLAREGSRENASMTGSLGEMAVYPPFAHWLAAIVSTLCKLPPPQVIQILSAFFAGSGALLLGLRYVRLLEKQGFSANAWRRTAFLLLSVLFGAGLSGFGVFGHVAFNFFYPQLVATVMALGSIELVKRCALRPFWLTLALSQLLGSLLLCTHLLAGLWFYLTAFIIIASNPDQKTRRGRMGGFAAISVIAIGVNPYTAAMVKIAANDGVLGSAFGALAFSRGLVLVYLLAAALSIFLVSAYYQRWIVTTPAFFHDHVGFFSIVALASGNTLAFLAFRVSSWYSLKKYVLIFSCELPLALITLGSLWVKSRQPQRTPSISFAAQIFLLLACTLAQIPWGRWSCREAGVLFYRTELLGRPVQGKGGRSYPQFEQLRCEENYYLAISILAIPRDQRTMQWLLRGCKGERAIELK